MRRLKLIGLALVAVFASAAALSTSAFALELPENLPASTTRTWTGKNVGVTKFFAEGQEPVECSTDKGSGTEATSKPPKGNFEIHFENCTSKAGGITVKCTGLGQATGVILATGTWALVFDKLVGKTFENLTSAVLFKNVATHFTCGGLVLIEVLPGETLCLHTNATTKSTKHEFNCTGETTKPKAIEEWGTDVSGVFTGGKVPSLTSSVNHATAVPSIQTGTGTVEYKEEVFADQ